MIFDATLFSDKPDDIAMVNMNMANSVHLDTADYVDVTDSNPIFMDMESLNDQQMIEARNIIRGVFPGQRIGAYGVYPRRDYWRAIRGADDLEYNKWVDENTLRIEAGKSMDIIFPSLYTFYEDQDGWEFTARENIKQARRYGREIMPFLWFEYHDGSALAGMEIPVDYWRKQIKLCLDMTGNAVIWGGWDVSGGTGRMRWDDNAPWYNVVKEFI